MLENLVEYDGFVFGLESVRAELDFENARPGGAMVQ